MLYSPGHRFLFVHIPKTGGTSLRAAFKPLLYRDPWYWLMWAPQRLSHLTQHRTVTKFPRHAKLVAAEEMLPSSVYRQLFIFSVVRNPWDRLVSAYHHLHKEFPEVVRWQDFEGFVQYGLEPDREPSYHVDVVVRPQIDYLVTFAGELGASYLVRFESLVGGIEEVQRRLGKRAAKLPHRRKGQRGRDYRSYYNDALAETVGRYYARDIATFGYTFTPPEAAGAPPASNADSLGNQLGSRRIVG
ncbi:MAG: sulfotransferase family 2 domain-containing protein [Opitutales bacterium]